eukprot:7270601-Lingulodinium_polyedra.AAC.1
MRAAHTAGTMTRTYYWVSAWAGLSFGFGGLCFGIIVGDFWRGAATNPGILDSVGSEDQISSSLP